jgi:hypothetical protein
MNAAKLQGFWNISASSITFAAGSSLIGTALEGPTGGVIFALVGAAIGIYAEMLSQKRHEQPSKRVSAEHGHE